LNGAGSYSGSRICETPRPFALALPRFAPKRGRMRSDDCP
jgi:hypothetical protein